jgi:hypothetical protein
MSNASRTFTQASIKTASMLRTIATTDMVRDLSHLSIPECEAVVRAVAEIIPAGNVPGVILNGLIHLPDRHPSPDIVHRDIQLLFTGLERFLDKVVYGAIFAGPAAVIWGYQNLLKLAGKDPEAAFPQGVWQFYVDYALREDTARHANETSGFDGMLQAHGLKLTKSDRLAAWLMASISTLVQYPELLANEWRERVYLALLAQAAGAEPARSPKENARLARLYRDWEALRPYGRGPDAASQTYPAYRRAKFDSFMQAALNGLPPSVRSRWEALVAEAESNSLPAYQTQMSIQAYLEPGPYGETHCPLALQQTHIGVIRDGAYFLIPITGPGGLADVYTVRAQALGILNDSTPVTASLAPLSGTQRAALPAILAKLDPATRTALDALHTAPILINSDLQPRWSNSSEGSKMRPLSQIRQAERGIGDHPLTIFDTGETIIFDQSHIFFDGATGAALAEIMTNEALSWAVYLHSLPHAKPGSNPPWRLIFDIPFSAAKAVRSASQVTDEVGAETEAVNIKALLRLRKLFKQRSDLLNLTVNDLLVLYRAIHAVTYRPNAALLADLHTLQAGSRTSAQAAAASALAALAKSVSPPAILIPVDASQRSPRDRLYPLNFEIPLEDLHLLDLHRQTLAALAAYQNATVERKSLYNAFDRLQREYMASLAGFGTVLSRAKAIALTGETASMGALKMLAYLPAPLQRMLEAVPTRIDMLNDIIKGREIFSNVGSVVPTSSLVRFITAKDDNDKKTLAWGVITDAAGIMRISLRDFRQHVGLLVQVGQAALAERIAQDYVNSYAEGLNRYVIDLQMITLANRPTRTAHSQEEGLV